MRQLEAACSDRTKAVFVAHTLGNVFDLDAVTAFTKKHNLWLIEDCCDALGSTYRGRNVGTFGDIASLSFYPAHHITTGEGGAVLTDKPTLQTLIESFRDWGRDCWCETGKDNTCGKRFDWQLGSLPCGYDHKYTYSHIGYNLKATDMQEALGTSQLTKLPEFIARRKQNFRYLEAALAGLEEIDFAESDAHWTLHGLVSRFGVREDAHHFGRGSNSHAGRRARSPRDFSSAKSGSAAGIVRDCQYRVAADLPQQRLRNEQCVLGGRISRTDASDARLRG